MLEEGEVQTLTELGLTGRQGRVFRVLSNFESATARALALASNLARQDIYKVLDELQTLGIVEKQITVPTKFAAVPIHDALSILLNRKVKQESDLEKKTRILIDNIKTQNKRTVEDEEPKILLIPEGETVVLKLRKAIESTQKSIDVFSTSRNLPQGMFFLTKDLKRAEGRGVKIQCIIESFEDECAHLTAFPVLKESPFFEIRTIPNHSKVRFCIFDKKELSVVLFSEKDFAKSSILWLNGTSFLEGFQDYFEMLWLRATRISQCKKIEALTNRTNKMSRVSGVDDRGQAVESLAG
jgi:sugar-specific transcriptional regulator TrmB